MGRVTLALTEGCGGIRASACAPCIASARARCMPKQTLAVSAHDVVCIVASTMDGVSAERCVSCLSGISLQIFGGKRQPSIVIVINMIT
jgi:hypothetical protein